MAVARAPITAAARFIHGRLLWLLIGSYALAALWPGPGLRLRDASLGAGFLFGQSIKISPPAILLAFLLFNSGLGVRLDRARDVLRRPRLLGTGLVVTLALPVAVTAGLALGLAWWPDTEEYRNLLVGLALIAAMPVAGSSAAWSQQTDGDLALSLGLVLGSTLLSPLTTPAVLWAVGTMASGDQARQLRELAGGGTGVFLALWVALPSLLGVLLRALIGGGRADSVTPPLALANSVALLLLCYGNAATALPQAVAYPDPDYLILNLVATAGLCASGFAAGWWIGRRVGAVRHPDQHPRARRRPGREVPPADGPAVRPEAGRVAGPAGVRPAVAGGVRVLPAQAAAWQRPRGQVRRDSCERVPAPGANS